MISSVAWIRKGASARHPTKYELTDEEFTDLASRIDLEVVDARTEYERAVALAGQEPAGDEFDEDESEESDEEMEGVEESTTTTTAAKTTTSDDNGIPDELKEYNLDNYDDEDEKGQKDIPIFSNIKGLAYYSNPSEDPYIQFDASNEAEEEEEERAQLEILPTDNVLVTCKTEDELSHLEVYVYIPSEDNLYVHHDIMLSSYPLALETVSNRVGKKRGMPGFGNYIAVGTFEPEIEIWDLDMVDSVYPDAILGGAPKDAHGNKKKTKQTSNKPNSERHVSAVLGLSANPQVPNLLASASADTTVKLWDLNANDYNTCLRSFNSLHKDKVSTLQFNPTEATVLATGGYDQLCCIMDTRAPDTAMKLTGFGSDIEMLKWHPHHPEQMLIATEDGIVRCFDLRAVQTELGSGKSKKQQQLPKSLWTLQAHDKAVTSMDLHPLVSDCLITGSSDKLVKIWDLEGNQPSCVVSRDMGAGKVFVANWCPDTPLLACVAGSKGKLVVWNAGENSGIRKVFGRRVNGDNGVGVNAAAAAAANAEGNMEGEGEGKTERAEFTMVVSDAEEEEEEGDDGAAEEVMMGMDEDEDEDEDSDEEEEVAPVAVNKGKKKGGKVAGKKGKKGIAMEE